jgi:putative ABC transport system permease protein
VVRQVPEETGGTEEDRQQPISQQPERPANPARGFRVKVHMAGLLLDLRFAVRLFVTRPTYTIAVAGTMAAAIAGNVAIFTLVNAVLLRPLPLPQPDRLVRIEERHGDALLNLTGATLADVTNRARSFGAIGGYRLYTPGLSAGAQPEQVLAADVSPAYFDVLGLGPVLGRSFEPHDFAPGARRVLLLSDGVWRRTFGGDPEAVGKVVLVSAEPAEVIGVMPPAMYAPGQPAIWRPRPPEAALERNRRAHLFTVIARLRPDRAVDAARSELDALASQVLQDSAHVDPDMQLVATPLQQRVVESVRPALLMLWAAVGLLLLLATVNITNLAMMQAAQRTRELAIRLAVGAGRGRLVRQLAVESLVLGLLGGSIGMAVGLWVAPVLASTLPMTLPGVSDLSPNGRLIAFGAALSIGASLLFGIGPAVLVSTRTTTLRDRSTPSSTPIRAALVACEVALTIVLLAAAGLLARSFTTVLRIDPGFDATDVVTFDLTLPSARYPDTRAHADFYQQVLDRIAFLPGITSTGVTGALPLRGTPTTTMVPEGRTEQDGLHADIVTVSPGFFATLRIPVRLGRAFSDRDRAGSLPVVVINEAAVKSFWPGSENPIGRRIVMRDWGEPYEAHVVGVVGNVRQMDIEMGERPAAYYPIAQFPETMLRETIVIRASVPPDQVIAAARAQILTIDRDQPVASVQLLEDVIAAATAQRRFNFVLVAAFACAAVLLAGFGVYGVVAFAIAQRTKEIGVRVALGARPASIVRLTARIATAPIASGLTLGIAGAFGAGRALESLLFGVHPTDAATLGAVIVAVLLLGAAACYLPTRRALRVDAASALRGE